tara:strand:+ start:1293 stop:2951 length:1659 start_codon:yes stop_codon:yes gene_type:complete
MRFPREILRFFQPSGISTTPVWVRDLFGIDLRSVALFRICLGLILLVDLFVRSADLGVFYTDAGVLPRADLLADFQRSNWLYSVHLMSGGAIFQLLLFVVAGIAAACMTLGYRTKTAALVSFFLLCSLQNRNPYILQGGDALLRVMHFWALFLPLGLRWSLDSRNREWAPPVGVSMRNPDQVVSIASAAILFQVAFMYWFTAGLKSDPIWWRDGLGIYYALNVDQFATPLGKWILHHEWLHRSLSMVTYFLEAFGPLVAFIPWKNAWFRIGTVATFVAFHWLGIRLTMDLGLFQWTCAAIWLLFLPALFWNRLIPKSLGWLRSLVARFEVLLRWSVQISRGLAVLRLGAKPVRPRWSEDREKLVPVVGIPVANVRTVLHSAFAAFFFVYVLAWNVRAADFDRYVTYFPRSLNWIGEVTGLRQYWSMFSPKPMLDDGWYVFTARKISGEVVDLRTRERVTWRKPDLVSKTYKNQRWRKYLMNLRLKKHKDHRKFLVPWLMKQWNETHDESERIVAMQMVYVKEQTTEKGTKPHEKIVLYEYHSHDSPFQLTKK